MNKHNEHKMPRLRQPRFDALQAAAPRRAHARQPGVMTPLELRAEVLALIG